MKSLVLSVLILASAVLQISGQAAGNYYFNQKSKADYSSSRGSRSYEADLEQNYLPQQQTYYNTVPAASDTAFTLSVSALMNVKADEYVIVFGASQIGETLESCHEMINKKIDAFIAAVTSNGISKKDCYVDFISQFPIFEIEVEKKLFSKTYTEIPSGYELRKNIHIHYKSFSQAEKLMTEAAKNEIFDIVKVDYIVNNHQAVYDSLRDAAVKLIQEKVSDFQKLGIKTESQYQLVAEDIQASFPLERYSTYAEFTRYRGNSGKMGSKVIAKYDVPALYYNRKSYNSFDIVINPVVLEPVVQFTYNIRVKYVLKKR
jgi:uncharacterized protein YggE